MSRSDVVQELQDLRTWVEALRTVRSTDRQAAIERIIAEIDRRAADRASTEATPPPDCDAWMGMTYVCTEPKGHEGEHLSLGKTVRQREAEERARASTEATERPDLPLPAIQRAVAWVEENITPRRCDNEGVSDCWRCTTVALARWLARAALTGATSASEPSREEEAR